MLSILRWHLLNWIHYSRGLRRSHSISRQVWGCLIDGAYSGYHVVGILLIWDTIRQLYSLIFRHYINITGKSWHFKSPAKWLFVKDNSGYSNTSLWISHSHFFMKPPIIYISNELRCFPYNNNILPWRHHVSKHQQRDCLFQSFFRL